MNKKELILMIVLVVVGTITMTAQTINIINNYELLSNEELQNITKNAYIQGTLYTSQTGNIPYISNDTIQITTINEVCQNIIQNEKKR